MHQYYEEDSRVPSRAGRLEEVSQRQTTVYPKSNKKRKATPKNPWKAPEHQEGRLREVAPPIPGAERPEFDSQGNIRGDVIYEQGAPSIPVIHQGYAEDPRDFAQPEDRPWWFDTMMRYAQLAFAVLFALVSLLLWARHIGLLQLPLH